MKRIALTCLIILFGFYQSYSQTTCDCWEKEFAGKELSYQAAVAEMEAAFIEKGYLAGKKPANYIQLMNTIIARNEYYLFGVVFNPTLVQKFESCFLSTSCDQATYKKIQKMDSLLVNYADISPEQTFRDFKEIFVKKDFKKPEVKHYFLTFYLNTISRVSPRLTPKVVRSHAPVQKRNILKVHVTASDSIYLNDQYVGFEDLKRLALKHISDVTNSQNST